MDSVTPTGLRFPVGALAGALRVAAGAPDYRPKVESRSTQGAAVAPAGETASAVFAGGCFWCTEADFEKVAGVISAVSGYTGGTIKSPSYEQVSSGGTGNYAAVKVPYAPARVSYEKLDAYFFRPVDPTDAGGPFCDRGES